MKLNYFIQDNADEDDMLLGMAIEQGYVPPTCLLGGMIIMAEVKNSRDPCSGCHCPRNKCHGRPPKRQSYEI